jgi:hypothetical protein
VSGPIMGLAELIVRQNLGLPPGKPPTGDRSVSATHVCTDRASLTEAVAKAGRGDKIVTLFGEGEGHPLLGFRPAAGEWFVAGWSMTQPCGTWTVGADGKAQCRVPSET